MTTTIAPPEGRAAPWRRLGTDVQAAGNATAALQLAGLDWEVEKVPVFAPVELDNIKQVGETDEFIGGFEQVPNRFVIRKVGVGPQDRTPLGIVGGDYRVFQNHEALALASALVDTGEVTFDTAGELRGGRWVWLALKFPKEILIAGEDPIGLNLAVRTSHDGSSAISAFVSPIRIWCENTLTMALKSATHVWAVRHTTNMEGRLEEARRALELSFKYTEEFAELGNHLAEQKFNEDQFHRLVEQLHPKQLRVQDELKEFWTKTLTLDGLKQTKWGALNVVAEFSDWGRAGRDPHAQVMSTWVGNSYRARNRALQLLTEEVTT